MSSIVGKVSKVDGVVEVLNPETGEVRTLIEGGDVFLGEIVQTSENGGVIIEFENGTFLTLGRSTQMLLDSELARTVSHLESGAEGDVTAGTETDVGNIDIEALQQAVLEGNFETLEATGAGGALIIGSAAEGGVFVERIAASGAVTSGFATGTDDPVVEDEREDIFEPEIRIVSLNTPINQVFEAALSTGSTTESTQEETPASFGVVSPDGIGSLVIGGTSIDLNNPSSTTVDTGKGTFEVTSISGPSGEDTYTINYIYTLITNQVHGSTGSSTDTNITDEIPIVVTSGSGDLTDSGTLSVTIVDDAPVVEVATDAPATSELLTQDEDTLLGVDTDTAINNFSNAFAPATVFGADGAGTVTYGLSLQVLSGTNAVFASGLYAVDSTDISLSDSDGYGQGSPILLYEVQEAGRTVIVGSSASVDTDITSSNTFFIISVDDSANVSFTQTQNVWHSDVSSGTEVESINLPIGQAVVLTKTVTDSEGDSGSGSVNLVGGNNVLDQTNLDFDASEHATQTSSAFTFGDNVTISAGTFTGSLPVDDATNSFTFTGSTFEYVSDYEGFGIRNLSGSDLSSEIDSNSQGQGVEFVSIDYSTASSNVLVTEANIVFNSLFANYDANVGSDGQIHVIALKDGVVVSDIVYDDDTNPDVFDGSGSFTANISVQNGFNELRVFTDVGEDSNGLNVNMVLGDIEVLSAIDLPLAEFSIQDQSPSVGLVLDSGAASVLTTQDGDVSNGLDTATSTANFGGVFSVTTSYEADGAGSTTMAYSLTLASGVSDGAVSGLTQGGSDITLHNNAGVIEGRVGNVVVFSIGVESSTGVVTLTQFSSVEHISGNANVDVVELASGLVELQGTATVVDGDGDSVSETETIDLGGNIRFEDDAPVAVADSASVFEGNTVTASVVEGVLINDAVGGDGANSPTIVGVVSGNQDSVDTENASVGTEIQGVYGTLTLNSDGSYTYVSTNGSVSANSVDEFVYTIKDADGDLTSTILSIDIENDPAPSSSGGSVTACEDTSYVFGVADFNFSDDGNDTLTKVRVDSLPTNGTLYLNGVVVAVDSEIAVSDISAGNFTFEPALNESGRDEYNAAGAGDQQNDYAVFNFSVSDGDNWSLQTAPMTIDISPVADSAELTVTSFKTETIRIDYTNFLSTDGGFRVTAYNADGSIGQVSQVIAGGDANDINGFGVSGQTDSSSEEREIGWDNTENASERLVVKLDEAVLSIDVTVVWKGPLEPSVWRFYRTVDGVREQVGADLENSFGTDGTDLYTDVSPGDGLLFDEVHFESYRAEADYLIQDIGFTKENVIETTRVSEGEALSLGITTNLQDTDGSESVVGLEVADIPVGLILTDGTKQFTSSAENKSVSIYGWDLNSLEVTVPEEFVASDTEYTLNIVATTREYLAGQMSSEDPDNCPLEKTTTEPYTITIVNTSSSAILTLSGDSEVVEGDAAANYRVSITESPSVDMTIDVTYTYQTAEASDITTNVTQVTIPAGSIFVDFTVDTVDDIFAEGGELYSVIISNPTLGGFDVVTLGTDTVQTEIVDDSVPSTESTSEEINVTLTGDTVVDEGDSATYTVTIDEPAQSDMVISVSTAHDTTNDDDLDATTRTVTIPAGQTSISFIVSNNVDDIEESDEIYNVALTGDVSGGGFETVIVDQTPVVTTIIDGYLPPESSGGSVIECEDTAYVFTAADFNFTGTDGYSLTTVEVDSLPVSGTLFLSGVAVSAGQEISITDIDAGNFTFSPAANESGRDEYSSAGTGDQQNDYSTFDFKVYDGKEWSIDSSAMTLDVTPVADPVTLTVSTTSETQIEINHTNFLSQDQGFRVTAYNTDGSEGTISEVEADPNLTPPYDEVSGFGVLGETIDGDTKEIGLDINGSGNSEALGVTFDGELMSSVDIQAAWQYTGERAGYVFYRDGVVLETVVSDGGSDGLDPITTIRPSSGEMFDEVRFIALPKLGNSGSASTDSDWLVSIIKFDSGDRVLTDAVVEGGTMGITINAELTDTDGSEAISAIRITDIPVGMVLTDGVERFTSTDGSQTVDIVTWDQSNLKVEVPDGYVALDTAYTMNVEVDTTESIAGSMVSDDPVNCPLTTTTSTAVTFTVENDPSQLILYSDDSEIDVFAIGTLEEVEIVDFNSAQDTLDLSEVITDSITENDLSDYLDFSTVDSPNGDDDTVDDTLITIDSNGEGVSGGSITLVYLRDQILDESDISDMNIDFD